MQKSFLLLCISACIFLFIADIVTKIIIVKYLHYGENIVVIPGFFNITYVTNRGAAWGIMQGYKNLLLLISLVVLCILIFYHRHLCEGWKERYIALTLIISGILGNSLDRFCRNEVVDFLDFYINGWHWPAFNVADSAITVGVTIYIISSFLRTQKIQKEEHLNPGEKMRNG